MYLHCRASFPDFLEIVKKNRHKFKKGVVHSFTGTVEEMNSILELDLYISINGLAFKTDENI